MLKEPQIYEEFQFFCFHSQLILIRHPLLDSLSKIVLNHERDCLFLIYLDTFFVYKRNQ